MKKSSHPKKQAQKISKQVMLATLASTMALMPSIYASTLDYTLIASNVQPQVNSVDALTILNSQGWLESAYVEWAPVTNATGYNVYYKLANASDSSYEQLDTELIRQYSSYMRADILGVSAGDYIIKIVPIINGEEDTLAAAMTTSLTVTPHVREGFAFSSESPMGTGSGGYNDDGTIPSNAQILYVSADTVNTVTLDVITNSKGSTTTCTGLTDILAKRQKGYDKTPLIIRMVGTITASDITGLNSNGYLQLKGCYNVTLEGVGEDATVSGWGILIRNAHNVEIRNLGIMLFPDDGISLDTDNENIWIHNNDIFYGTAGSDADQAKGDGSCDVKGFSNYVTISYNHFYDSGKSSLCGMSDTKEFFVTYHHNWYDHSDSRHPRIRVGTIHIYNNYFDGNSKYGVGITKGGSAFVEANYFRNCKYPMLISLQGTDVYQGNTGTFSGEAGGMIKAYNNSIEGATRLVYANEDATEFDAYLATSREEQVPATYTTVSGSNTYNNFDTSQSMYDYTPDAPEDVKNIVTTYAGRVNGGDLDWTFTAADDTDSSLNTALMAKLKSYESDLVAIGGHSIVTPSETPDTGETTNPSETPSTDETTDSSETPNTGETTDSSVSVGSLTSTGMYTNLSQAADSEFTGAVYVSPNGLADNDGTSNAPLDLLTALEYVENGQAASILLQSGTYSFDSQITISASGTEDAYNVLKACEGANVVLDFSGQTYNSSDTSLNDRGIQLNGNYWYIQGITITGAADNGMMVSGSYNIIERCIFDGNKDSGLQISRRSSSVTDFKDFPSYNYIINCTSKNNCDPATYENADGFAAKLTCGDGNVFDGCLSYNNSDDGWDLYAKTATGSIGIVTLRNCIAMRNGMTEDGLTNSNCDGNGFKLGGSGVPTPHIITNCIAIENLHHGFTDNNNPSALELTNCTAFNNNQGGSKNNFSLYRCQDAIVSNSISYTTNNTSDKFINLSADHLIYSNSKKWYKVTDHQAVDTSSSASRGEVISAGPDASDFINATVPSVGTDFDTLWRNPDGTLNTQGVAIISESSEFATFSSDGNIIGARLSSDNKISTLSITPNTNANSIPENGGNTDNGTTDGGTTDGGTTDGGTTDGGTTDGEETSKTLIHNFTTNGSDSDFFTITGALSTIKGTVEYNGLVLTQCLKIDSKANISFTTTDTSNLTLVFNSDFNGEINIDDTNYAVTNGVLTLSLNAGTHTIKKAVTANLYYIELAY